MFTCSESACLHYLMPNRLLWKQLMWICSPSRLLVRVSDGRRSLGHPRRAGNVPDSEALACNNPHPQMNIHNTHPARDPQGRAAGESGATSSDPIGSWTHELAGKTSAVWNHSGERDSDVLALVPGVLF